MIKRQKTQTVRHHDKVALSHLADSIERFHAAVAILVYQNNETAAMLMFQTNPVGVEFFSYANASFRSNKFA